MSNTPEKNTSNLEENERYLNLDQLLPLEDPDEALKKAVEGLKSTDWSRQFDSCNTIRRACMNHSAILTANSITYIHALTYGIVKILESLRSSLVKNCILALIDMVKTLKRSMDLEIESILGSVIKKALESNSFIGGHVNELLEAICENCSEARIVTALLNIMGANKSTVAIVNPAPQIKLRVINCVEQIIARLGSKFLTFKDNEKIISLLSTFLSEGSLELRKAAKRALLLASNESINQIEFDRLLQHSVNESTYNKIKSVLKKSRKEEGDSPILTSSSKSK